MTDPTDEHIAKMRAKAEAASHGLPDAAARLDNHQAVAT